jgi:hypothetical protein
MDGHAERKSARSEPNEARLIPQQPTPVRINLWLFRGMAPFDGAEVEIIISQFAFTPIDQLDWASVP